MKTTALVLLLLRMITGYRVLLPHRDKVKHVKKLYGKGRYKFSRSLPDEDEDYLEYREALVDGRVLGAGFRKSVDPELWEFGVPAKVSARTWLTSGLWYGTTAFSTGVRVVLPAILACVFSVHFFPVVSYWLASHCLCIGDFISSGGAFALIPQLNQLIGLIFSVFTNFTFQAMYEQQEAAMLALFAEVSCTKALVEQILLVFGSETKKPNSRCTRALRCVRRYCAQDLRRRASRSSEQLRLMTFQRNAPLTDPLEELLYLSSVGDPSDHVYATIKELRKIRANRLGALERKLPPLHFIILYVLQFLLLFGFIAETAALILQPTFTPSDLRLQTAVFAISAFALTACLRVLQDIWSRKSGAYNIDAVLVTSVIGLEKQLDDLLANSGSHPSSLALEKAALTSNHHNNSSEEDSNRDSLFTKYKQWPFPLQQPSPVWASGYI